MNKTAERFIEKIHKTLDSACSASGAADTSPSKMKRIGKLIKNKKLHLVFENDRQRATSRAIKLLKHGFPVIVSKERGTPRRHHYAVATQLRQRLRYYRSCSEGKCSEWRTEAENEMFVHMGLGPKGDKWENVETYFMAAVIKP